MWKSAEDRERERIAEREHWERLRKEARIQEIDQERALAREKRNSTVWECGAELTYVVSEWLNAEAEEKEAKAEIRKNGITLDRAEDAARAHLKSVQRASLLEKAIRSLNLARYEAS